MSKGNNTAGGMNITVSISARQISSVINNLVEDVGNYEADVRKAAGVKINDLKAQLAGDAELMERIQRVLAKAAREAVLTELEYGPIYGDEVKAVRAADRACQAVLDRRAEGERISQAIELLGKRGFKVTAKQAEAA
jgi:hypothetical protein